MSSEKRKKLLKFGTLTFLFLVILIVFLWKIGVFSKSPKIQNFILVSIDDLRADRLGCYGHKRNTSPFMDQLAEKGTQFMRAFVPWPMTLRSHGSMFTSLYPAIFEFPLDPSVKTIAGILSNHGYRTAALTGGGFMSHNFGLLKGFEEYDDNVRLPLHLRNKTVKWLEKNQHNKFFLFLHTFYVHQPYQAPPEYFKKFADPNYKGPVQNGDPQLGSLLKRANYGNAKVTPADRQRILDIYDAQIIRMDERIHQIIKALERLNLAEKTMVIITSDHGEQFYEFHWFGHTSQESPFPDISTRVPFIVYCPSLPPMGKVDPFVEIIDIPPTILDAAGIKIPGYFQGRSLYPVLCDKPKSLKKKEEIFFRNGFFMGIRTNDLKLTVNFRTGEPKLFDLTNDPQEKKNIVDEYSAEKVNSLMEKLNEYVEKNEKLRKRLNISNIKLDREVLVNPFSFDKNTRLLSSFSDQTYRYRKDNSSLKGKIEQGPFKFVKGKYGKGVILEKGKEIHFPLKTLLLDESGSLEFQFKLNEKGSQNQKFFHSVFREKEGILTLQARINWKEREKNRVSFTITKIEQGKIEQEINFSTRLLWKKWHHFLLAWTQNEIFLLIDGLLVSREKILSKNFFKQENTHHVKIRGENCTLDEFRISNSRRIMWSHNRKQSLDKKVLERLKALGYIH